MEYGLVLGWLVAYAVLTLVGLPIASVIFARFPGRGATFALPVSLAVLTLVAYWVGHLTFGPLAVGVAVAVLLFASALAVRAGGTVHLRPYLGAMAVFTLAFLFMVAIRAVDPAVHPAGGEKFLDFGLIKTVLRADRLPPEDFWFAGKSLRYYYGGFLMTGILSMLTDTPARYAYNLALAGFYATLVTAAYGLAGAIADTHGRSVRAAGACAVFFVGVAGNLATPARMILGVLPRELAAQYGHVFLGAIRGVPPEGLLGTITSPKGFSYWYARYVIEGTLNVFPLWSFLNGDLNAFMIAMTFLLGCAALCFAYYRTQEEELARRRALVFLAFPPAAGLCALISTWSFPSAVGLLWLSLTFADARPTTLLPRLSRYVSNRTIGGSRLHSEVSRPAVAAVLAVAAGLFGTAWASPFLLFNKPVVRGVVLFPPRSGLIQLFLVHGAFLAVFALYLLARRPPWLRKRLSHTSTGTLAAAGLAGIVLFVVLGFFANLAAVALVGPFLLAGWLWCRTHTDSAREQADTPESAIFGVGNPGVGYEVVLLVAGAGLVLVVEFAYMSAGALTQNVRWKTVFKVYLQVWVLWGTAAGVAFAWLLGSVRDGLSRALAGGPPAPRPRSAFVVFLSVAVVTVLVLSGTSTFAVLALSDHFRPTISHSDATDPTLDATRFVERTHPAEAEAIDWLDSIEGQPNIVTEPGLDMYSWTSAPSSLTGIPTVVGWAHEQGYRGAEAFDPRVADVTTIYTGSWSAVAPLLDKYDVRYIYVGPPARERYGAIQDFSTHPGVSVAFENQWVTIYSVAPALVCEPTDTADCDIPKSDTLSS